MKNKIKFFYSKEKKRIFAAREKVAVSEEKMQQKFIFCVRHVQNYLKMQLISSTKNDNCDAVNEKKINLLV